MIANAPEPKKQPRRWFASLTYPVDAMTYECCDDPDIALETLEDAYAVYQRILLLKRDGWEMDYHWTEDDRAFYALDHPECETASDVNVRLERLGVSGITCLDLDKPDTLFGLL